MFSGFRVRGKFVRITQPLQTDLPNQVSSLFLRELASIPGSWLTAVFKLSFTIMLADASRVLSPKHPIEPTKSLCRHPKNPNHTHTKMYTSISIIYIYIHTYIIHTYYIVYHLQCIIYKFLLFSTRAHLPDVFQDSLTRPPPARVLTRQRLPRRPPSSPSKRGKD